MNFCVSTIPLQCAARAAVLALFVLAGAVPAWSAEGVFAGPPAPYQEPIASPGAAAGPVLRTISVEERVGVVRHGALVRVPLFFAAGECPDLASLAIVPEDNRGPPVVWQADDIRHGPDGGISRVHLWFALDLGPGEHRRFVLTRRNAASDTKSRPAIPLDSSSTDEIRVVTDSGPVIWDRGGGLRQFGRNWSFHGAGALPRVMIHFPGKGPESRVTFDGQTPGRVFDWGTGPVFAKLRLRMVQAGGVAFEEDFRIPRDGRELIISASLFPGDRAGSVVKEFRLLEGMSTAPRDVRPAIVRIPAGIRYALRAEHAYTLTALTSASAPGALLSVPLVLGGSNGAWTIDDSGQVAVYGQRGLQRGSEGEKDTLFGYFTEVRLVPADAEAPDELWSVYREHVQPLVAIVDEPGVTLETLHAALAAIVREMKPIGWRQEAGRAQVLGDRATVNRILARLGNSKEADAEYLLRGAKNARDKITQNGARALRDDEKGRAYGALDPYHITYTQGAAAAIAVLDHAPAASAVNLAMARGVREAGGRVDAAGNPYIDCFSRTLNMQMGPVLFGLTAGAAAGDDSLRRFYRDLATSPPVLGIFGRGQRPYTGAPATSPDQTDFLYQSICDLWLRAAELLGQENLELHPLAYGRYTDTIDVTADRYHGFAAHDQAGMPSAARANFFRGQVHTHRWLGWSCAPFIRLLADPAESGRVGVTEAARYAQMMKGRWKNWPDLTFYILADLLVREALPHYVPPALPALPARLSVRRVGDDMELRWDAVPGATEYRIYRTTKPGGPYRWLNSRYVERPLPPVTAPQFHDAHAPENASYMVTAVDGHGRESAWPENK